MQWITPRRNDLRLFLTAPHSGERIPPEATWLRDLPEDTLLTDVDRFVDVLYQPAATLLNIPLLTTSVHRYVVDLNRWPEDVDASSVRGSLNPPGSFSKGFHWVQTTQGQPLITAPMSVNEHTMLAKKYFETFHEMARAHFETLLKIHPSRLVYHLDCHSMPSKGTGAHRDSGQTRADVVISDLHGKSASAAFKDYVIDCFKGAGLNVAYNFPYYGGRITETYGKPENRQNTLQIELNRALYMNEKTREPLASFKELVDALVVILRKTVVFVENN